MKKGVLIGLLSGLMLAGASFTFANSYIQAMLNDQIKVTLNGVVQTFRDESTNEVQYPITYKNRTYLPLRTVANLVGVGVDYNVETNTAILTSTKSQESIFGEKYKIITLVDPYNSGIQSNIKIFDENSEVISENIFYDEQTKKFDYKVDGDKLLFSAYEMFNPSESEENGLTRLYRVYYEVVEENGTLKVNVIKEDKNDIEHTAAV